MPTKGKGITSHKVVPHAEWLRARLVLLAREKKFTGLRDRLSRQRRELPWEKVEKDYVFDGPKGKESLADLFGGKRQLILYHFMWDPRWKEGCPHCSFWADNFNGIDVHLRQRDVTMLAVSRAPLKKLTKFKRRMKWSFQWVSSHRSDFNHDYSVSFTPKEMKTGKAFYNYRFMRAPCAEMPGVSVFYRDRRGAIFHTYSSYGRGIDMLNLAYQYLDLAPKGRDEAGPGNPQQWVRYHDRYPQGTGTS